MTPEFLYIGLAALVLLLLLYLWGVLRAYRAAGDTWKAMDRDVRLVFLLTVPLFRAAIQLLLWLDKLFYTPPSHHRSGHEREDEIAFP